MCSRTTGVSVTGSASRPEHSSFHGMGSNRCSSSRTGCRINRSVLASADVPAQTRMGPLAFDLDDVSQIEVAEGAGSSSMLRMPSAGTIVT